ncbi:UDP-4-amino-4,6-dideoxy-N-acetyl-beta-L-altrosamine N-acetyltransferase [Oceanobacillus senegalensis]|uniref:UDP-4-amino-4, 6-dideoxy-N-acetyl-beta-L-altrosamine N-acetyltransferase n=1 Tax=Oceanobacillus senegalensis TaxID=1936063 RepID=UPI000A310316|nr:UDP-4-amino-4,6-dideoxy-N-acetyl-beta-L-altrosamine N-acetyltransferase [Oceanobacillus senegalensis]
MAKIEQFQLKPVCFDELQVILNWRNSERIKSWMYTDHQISWKEHVEWFHNVQEDPSKRVLVLHGKGRPLGVVNFTDIQKRNARCYWGFYIGDEKAPKGSGTIMGILALDKIFHEMQINKVCSEVIATNQASYRFHQKFGFEMEGRLKNHIWKNQHYLDVIQMALFANKWKHHRLNLLKDLEG